jgi:hypothetical protein
LILLSELVLQLLQLNELSQKQPEEEVEEEEQLKLKLISHQKQLQELNYVLMALMIQLIQTVVSTQEEKENIVVLTEPTIHLVSFQQLLEQHDHQRLEHCQQQLNLNVLMVHLTQLSLIVVSTQEGKENIVVQMELITQNASSQQLPELHVHQLRSLGQNVQTVLPILPILTVVLMQEEKENIVAQMELTTKSVKSQLEQLDLQEHAHQLKLLPKDLLEDQLEEDPLKLQHIFHLRPLLWD